MTLSELFSLSLSSALYANRADALVPVIFLILSIRMGRKRIAVSIGATIHFSNETWFVAPINTVNALSSCLFNVRTTMRAAQSRDEKNWRGRLLASRLRSPVYLYYIFWRDVISKRRISLRIPCFSFFYLLFSSAENLVKFMTNLSTVKGISYEWWIMFYIVLLIKSE